MRYFYFIIAVFFYFSFNASNAVVISNVVLENNERISKETIITYGDIKLNKDYNQNELNEILYNLYNTNFFEDVKIQIKEDSLVITVKENKIIQEVIVDGIKSKNLEEAILKNLYSKDKAPFLVNKIKQDVNRILTSLNRSGFYFAEVESSIVENNNNTVNLLFKINLGDKAKIGKIEFIGDKKIKDRTLRNLIVSEEEKFWKFISKNVYLNESLINRDERLLKSYYLNRGYYDVQVTSTSATFLDNNTFKLIYKIDAGTQYIVNNTKLILPVEYDSKNFKDVNLALKKMNNEIYSFNKVSEVVDEIDKISLSREYDFINAKVVEKKINDNKIDIEFKIEESERFYVERINIYGNNITHESVIRNSLEVDEGDPFNELLNAKSINNLKSLSIFKSVEGNVEDGKEPNTKIVNINVEEKPTGAISLGAGYGSEGGTIGFSVSENNFLGKNIKLTTSLKTSESSITGGFRVVNPNFNYSNKALITNLENSSVDKLSTNGYKTNKTGFSLGTGYEQFENAYFRPKIATYIEDVETSSKASAALKKQTGGYFETRFNYSLDFDQRNQRFQTSEGSRNTFSQGIPLVSDEYALMNLFSSEKWFTFGENIITKFSVYGKMINSLNDKDVRITNRLSLPRKKLKGFKAEAIGPVDNSDYVGGNYATSVNFDTTLPMILPSVETVDFKYFIDIGNVWGVDYSDQVDESNKIRSSTGITVDWFTPIGPLNFSLAQDITKASTDKTESFQFNLGTTF